MKSLSSLVFYPVRKKRPNGQQLQFGYYCRCMVSSTEDTNDRNTSSAISALSISRRAMGILSSVWFFLVPRRTTTYIDMCICMHVYVIRPLKGSCFLLEVRLLLREPRHWCRCHHGHYELKITAWSLPLLLMRFYRSRIRFSVQVSSSLHRYDSLHNCIKSYHWALAPSDPYLYRELTQRQIYTCKLFNL